MGPLKGIKVIEIASIGPGPFCAMMLADMGAEVIRVERQSAQGTGSKYDVLNRGRRSIAIDLKRPEGVETVLRLVAHADALIEGFRPGVMERLGLGPEVCFGRNQQLVYGRVTGWGQTGPLREAAGHDINYIALSGALHAVGRAGEKPVPPLNLVGDFGGGGMLLAFGVVCGILESRGSGQGQVIDAAMTDGAALQMAMIYGLKAAGKWSSQRGTNLLDGGAHFYDTYECADKKFIAIGAIEPQFYALLLEKAELSDPAFRMQLDATQWPDLKNKLTTLFKTKTRDEWCGLMEGTDVCFAPVLDLDEAPRHAHNAARRTFVEVEGVIQPAPAPRFSRTQPGIQSSPSDAGQQVDEALVEWGL
ncbi:MAG: CoA transferase [Acidobacteriota bacterium]|nr:CoA transferase [Acidobacteriota bacterium]